MRIRRWKKPRAPSNSQAGTAFPKIYLIVGGDPRGTHVGSVFLRDLLCDYPREKLTRYALIRQVPRMSEEESSWMDFTLRIRNHPTEIPKGKWVNQYTRPWISLFTFIRYRFRQAPQLAQKILHDAVRDKPDSIWVILNSPFLICLAKCLTGQSSVPVVVSVWDPPEKFTVDLSMPRMAAEWMLRDFKYAVQHSRRLATASPGMQKEYLRRYSKPSHVLIHGFSRRLWRQPITQPHKKNELLIGFAGSLYAGREWQALLETLDMKGWVISGRKVKLRILSGSAVIRSSSPRAHIEYLGWRGLEEAVRLLSSVDIAYLPYWLEEKYRIATTLCFPNKLSVYTAAGIPVFYHGPADGSPGVFLQEYPMGVGCPSLNIQDIGGMLERYAADTGFYRSAAEAINRARREVLNREVFVNQFSEFIGMESVS